MHWNFELIGTTLDDAAGEAFDKVASILGLGFPGGPAVEREAAGGNPKAFPFPRSLLHDPRLDFSFSGLKTAVLYAVHGSDLSRPDIPPPGQLRANLAASFQQAAVDVLVEKARQALRRTRLKRLAVGGGVAANEALCAALERMTAEEKAELFIPPLVLCTDNAAMAAMAVEKWRLGDFAPLDLDAVPAYSGTRRHGRRVAAELEPIFPRLRLSWQTPLTARIGAICLTCVDGTLRASKKEWTATGMVAWRRL